MRSLSLRPNDSLAILKDGFVDRLSSLRFLHEDDPSYRVLTVSLVSLTLTEYACLFWTHVPPLSFPNCHLRETRQLTLATLPPCHSGRVQ